MTEEFLLGKIEEIELQIAEGKPVITPKSYNGVSVSMSVPDAMKRLKFLYK
ncbi:hypothetical protein FACS189454_08660 [Planctomycetales bacterium]|nr:hypothetical protein FACS189454_08660 [Planctomycetales bacterium]